MKSTSWRPALLLAAPAMLALVACAETWTKTGSAASDLETAKATCTARATEKFPPLPQRAALPDAPSTASCYASGTMVNCYSSLAQSAPTFVTIDRNDPERTQAMRACMVESGWQQSGGK
jgi:hypothetical protein